MAQNKQNICSIFIFMQRQNKQWLSTINWKFLQKQRWHGSRQWKRNTHWHDRKIYGLHFVIKSISMCESVKYLLVICSWVCRLALPQPPTTTTTMTIATTTRQLNEKKKENEMKKERPTTASSLIFHSFIRKHNICLLLTCVIVAAVLFKHSSLMPKVILYWSPFVQFDISFGVL